jgi:hypothetical protein
VGYQAPHRLTAGSTIGQAWDKYRSMVMPPAAGAIQIRECRLAFYAGAQEVLLSLMRIEAGPPGIDPTEHQLLDGVEHLERMRLELEEFAQGLHLRR